MGPIVSQGKCGFIASQPQPKCFLVPEGQQEWLTPLAYESQAQESPKEIFFFSQWDHWLHPVLYNVSIMGV
jgi:hypothetical protein